MLYTILLVKDQKFYPSMTFITFLQTITTIILTVATLIKLLGTNCECPFITKMMHYLGHQKVTSEMIFLLDLGKLYILLLLCNYFALRFCTRFLIKNLVVLHGIYTIYSKLDFNFNMVANIFTLAVYVLGASTIIHPIKFIKNSLFTSFVVINLFLVLIITVPNFEMAVLMFKLRF